MKKITTTTKTTLYEMLAMAKGRKTIQGYLGQVNLIMIFCFPV